MKNISKNSQFSLLVSALAVSVGLLNFCTSIYQCAAIFVGISLFTNILAEYHGRDKSLGILSVISLISLALQWNIDYYIAGKILSGLVVVSLSALVFSNVIATALLGKSKSSFNFLRRNMVSTVIAGLVDGLVMAIYFINVFEMQLVFSIFARELLCKVIYSAVFYMFAVALFNSLEYYKTARK